MNDQFPMPNDQRNYERAKRVTGVGSLELGHSLEPIMTNYQCPMTSESAKARPAFGHWALVIHWSLVIGHWSFDTGHFLLLLWRPLKVNSAMPDLSNSPKPSLTMRSYCFFVAAANGRLRPFSLARLKAMPESLAACAPEKKQECSRFCMSSPSVWSTRELAPV